MFTKFLGPHELTRGQKSYVGNEFGVSIHILFLDQVDSNWFSNLQYTSECICLILTYNKHLLDIQNSRKHFFRNSILNKYWIKSCFLPLSTYIASLICINDCCLFGRHTPYVRDEQNVAPGRNVLILGTVVAHSGARSGWGSTGPGWGKTGPGGWEAAQSWLGQPKQ